MELLEIGPVQYLSREGANHIHTNQPQLNHSIGVFYSILNPPVHTYYVQYVQQFNICHRRDYNENRCFDFLDSLANKRIARSPEGSLSGSHPSES